MGMELSSQLWNGTVGSLVEVARRAERQVVARSKAGSWGEISNTRRTVTYVVGAASSSPHREVFAVCADLGELQHHGCIEPAVPGFGMKICKASRDGELLGKGDW